MNLVHFGGKWDSTGGARRSTDSSLGAPLDPWGDLWDHLGLFEPSEGVESSKIGPKLGPKSGSGRASRFFSGGVFQLALSLSGYHRSLVGRTRMATICMSSLVRAPPKESKSCKTLQSGQKRKREPTYLDMSRKGWKRTRRKATL